MLLLVALILRLITLSYPATYVFDEVYFAKFANSLVSGQVDFDIHPPTGKLIISLGIRLFGFNSQGYRVASAAFGILFLVSIFLFTKELFSNKRLAIFTTFLFSLEGIYLVYSRLALIDIFMLTFGVLAIYFLLRNINSGQIGFLFLSGLFAGLTMSVKWIGAGILPVLFVFWLLEKKGKRFRDFIWLFIFLLLLPVFVYLASFLFIFKEEFLSRVLEWHRQVWEYNTKLTEGHPYGSVWWTWPLLLRPVWFYYNNDIPKTISGIIAIGNPALWWSASVAIVINLIFNHKWQDSRLSGLAFGWAAFFLPWGMVQRVLFLYHYLFPSVFALCILSFFLWQMLQKERYRLLALFLIVIYTGMFFLFLPLWTGWPIPDWFYRAHIWTNRWI